MIACAAVLISAAVATTAVVLGPMVWVDYLTKIHALELYWGTGTPVYMMNVRGVLTRIVGLSAHSTIDAFSKAVWAAAMAFTGVVLVVRGTGRAADPRPAYAFAIAISLLTNPHLFIHDTIIWAIPLLLFAAARRDAGLSWQPIVQLALAWPLVFFIAGSLLNRNAGRLIWLDPEMALLVGTAAIIGIGWPAARSAGCRRRRSGCTLSCPALAGPWRHDPPCPPPPRLWRVRRSFTRRRKGGHYVRSAIVPARRRRSAACARRGGATRIDSTTWSARSRGRLRNAVGVRPVTVWNAR